MSAATCTIAAPGVAAVFAPELAMVGCSLTYDGDELLVQNDGLDAYRERGATFGIPLLHPWANRLARPLPASELVHRDRNGLPIHGVLPRVLPFTVTEQTASSVRAEFDTHDHPDVLEVFPHPHSLTVAADLSLEGLEIRTTLLAYGRRPVPVAFGYHPYLRVPGLPRAEWTVDIPVRTRLVLDERMIPTGQREPVRIEPAPLGGRSFDDAYTDLGAHPRFTVGGRRAHDRGRVPGGLRLRAGVRARRSRARLLRADDGPDERHRKRRRPHDGAAGRDLHRRVSHHR